MPDQSSRQDKQDLSRYYHPSKQGKTPRQPSDANAEDVEKIKENVENIKQLLHGIKSYLRE